MSKKHCQLAHITLVEDLPGASFFFDFARRFEAFSFLLSPFELFVVPEFHALLVKYFGASIMRRTVLFSFPSLFNLC
jgi:hypothetical protein